MRSFLQSLLAIRISSSQTKWHFFNVIVHCPDTLKNLKLLLLLFALSSLLFLSGCSSSTSEPTSPATLTVTQETTLWLIFIGVLSFVIAIEAYNGLIKQEVMYPIGYLIGAGLGLAIVYIFNFFNDWGGLLIIFGWYVGSNLIQIKAQGFYARIVGLFWLLVLSGLLFAAWNLLQ
ncbi:MAG: hypothetical protein KDE48_10330 [Anaerolineales bacterium]|nr:hypothetical protein [Anaerolineales bacterium]